MKRKLVLILEDGKTLKKMVKKWFNTIGFGHLCNGKDYYVSNEGPG